MNTPGIDTQVIKTIEHPNFIEKHEKWTPSDTDPPVNLVCCYNTDGHYIGDLETAKYICDEKGIKPELRKPGMNVCSVGFCDKDNKWYGWSHRAMVGFKVGDKLFEENFGDDKTPFIEHGKKAITNLDEAREAAARFAESVAASIPDSQTVAAAMASNVDSKTFLRGLTFSYQLNKYIGLLERYRALDYHIEHIGVLQ
jgi:hypothetical protein